VSGRGKVVSSPGDTSSRVRAQLPAVRSTGSDDSGKPPAVPGGGGADAGAGGGGKPPLLPRGASSDATADTSTAASGEGQVNLEDTWNSTASKEFSFGTTKPAQLPKAPELERIISGHLSEATAAEPGPHATGSTSDVASAKTRPQAIDPISTEPSEKLSPEAISDAVPAEECQVQAQPDELENAAVEAARPTSPLARPGTPDSEAGEMFTFGTTNPLQLPDPGHLRQIASCQDAAVPDRGVDATGLSGISAPEQRRTPRWEPDAPLPPVQEVTPPPPLAPPDQAVALRSNYSSPQRSRSGLTAVEVATPGAAGSTTPPMPQVPPAPQQYYHPQVSQTWHGQQAPPHPELQSQTLPPEYAHMVSEALQQVLQKQQAEAAEYHHQVMRAQESEVYRHQEIVEHPFGRRDSLSSTIAQYEFPLADENNMTYSDNYEKYFGGEETDDDTLKVPPRQRGKRLAASCAVIILAALAVGSVVVFVQTF